MKKTNLKDILVLLYSLWSKLLDFYHSEATFWSTLPCLHSYIYIYIYIYLFYFILFYPFLSALNSCNFWHFFGKLCYNPLRVKFMFSIFKKKKVDMVYIAWYNILTSRIYIFKFHDQVSSNLVFPSSCTSSY
jgi:hypothetical protein